MGRLGRLLSYVYSKVLEDSVGRIKYDPGGGANITADHAEPANQTSRPLPDDIIVAMPVPGEGREIVIAFVDPKNPQDIGPGEHLTYSRDSEGVIKARIHLKSDGSINLNGVIISPTGSISAPSVIVGGKELADHDHPYTWTDGPGSGDTGPNN